MFDETQAGTPAPIPAAPPAPPETPPAAPVTPDPAVAEGLTPAPTAPPVSETPPAEADPAKPGPEPTASESSGTGDQAGGAIEEQPDEKVQEPAQPPVSQQGVCIDGHVYRGRSDQDVLTGFFCRVIAGEHQGRYGVYTSTASVDPMGWPIDVTIRTRDEHDEYLTVAYEDVRPAAAGGR